MHSSLRESPILTDRVAKNFPILGAICLNLPNRVKKHLLPGHINLAEVRNKKLKDLLLRGVI